MAKDIEGFEELEKRLNALIEISSKATARNALQRAINRSAEPMKNAAKANAPVGSGDQNEQSLKESIVVSRKATDSSRPAKIRDGVGVYVRTTAPHAHLVEFGSGPRYQFSKTDGMKPKYVGQMPPNPFLTKAFDETKDQVVAILGKNVGEEITKSWDRAERKAARLAAKDAGE